MVKYNKLFSILALRGMKRIDLVNNKVISGPTLTKLIKGQNVTISSIDKVCCYLKVQPSEIMEIY